jgi:hypothetical protein
MGGEKSDGEPAKQLCQSRADAQRPLSAAVGQLVSDGSLLEQDWHFFHFEL